jgi:hypothetical protein
MASDNSVALDATHYAFKPSLVGPPAEFVLGDNEVEWRRGNRSVRVAYRDVRHVRLLFRPVTMQHFRFIAEVRSGAGVKLTIASTSWRSMVEQERLDGPYKAFLAEPHRRIAASGASVIYRSGAPAFLYWPGAAIFVGLMAATIFLAVGAMSSGEWKGAAVVATLMGLFVWQMGTFFRRNLPGSYTPDDLPARALP